MLSVVFPLPQSEGHLALPLLLLGSLFQEEGPLHYFEAVLLVNFINLFRLGSFLEYLLLYLLGAGISVVLISAFRFH